jgi:bifunctional non-homologous end joining protein LigD
MVLVGRHRHEVGSSAVPRRPSRPSKSKLPDFIPPELATLMDKAPAGDDWLSEIKFDGYRIGARLEC